MLVFFLPFLTFLCHLSLIMMPRPQELAIFVWMMATTDDSTDHCTPCSCACVRGNKLGCKFSFMSICDTGIQNILLPFWSHPDNIISYFR